MKLRKAVVPILFLNAAVVAHAETSDTGMPVPAGVATASAVAAGGGGAGASTIEWQPLPPPVVTTSAPSAPRAAGPSTTPTEAGKPVGQVAPDGAAAFRQAPTGGWTGRGAPAAVWHGASRAEAEAQALVRAEQVRGTPSAGEGRDGSVAEQASTAARAMPAGKASPAAQAAAVEAQALGALAQHAARVMGADSARWSGLADTGGAAAGNAAPVPTPMPTPTPTVAPVAPPTKDRVAPNGIGGPIEAVVPARVLDSGAGRFGNGRSGSAGLASDFDPVIEAAARKHDVSPDLVRAVVKVESNFQPLARSPKGATGLMQLMPATAKRFGATDLTDPHTNIHAGTKYLSKLLTRFDGNLRLALAAYNAGEGAVEKFGRQIPPYPETQNYVTKVLAHYDGAPAPGERSERVVNAAAERKAAAGRASGMASSTLAAGIPRGVAGWIEAVLTSAGRSARRDRTDQTEGTDRYGPAADTSRDTSHDTSRDSRRDTSRDTSRNPRAGLLAGSGADPQADARAGFRADPRADSRAGMQSIPAAGVSRVQLASTAEPANAYVSGQWRRMDVAIEAR